ncbi:MAG: DUF2207 domain-containing protein [Candidatus Zixiibacteriota bacterium]|nr:MAG: DUF2207 domain-containing protein [candidate division Zixibacteria bacterium]
MSKKLLLWLSAVALVITVGLSSRAGAREYFIINNFHADINIHEDGSIVVRETIELTFDRQRHGIYREIPYKYENELGRTVRMPIKILDVRKEDDSKWKYKVSRKGSVVNVRIGDPDVYVRGKQIYVIYYRVENALMFFEDHDELYWNITGNYWDVPIEQATATLNLVSEVLSSQLLTNCYTGSYGRRESDCDYESVGNSATFTALRPLRAREGLTVAFGWDKGIVRPPSAWQQFLIRYNLAENWIYIIPVIVLIFMFNQWYRKGRDPQVRESVVVMYEPPIFDGKELSAAEVGSLIDERMDARDLTGALIGLAVKGYLQIEETKKEGFISLFDSIDYKLIKLKEPDSEISPFEKQLMEALFTGYGTIVMVSKLKNKFYKNLKSLRKTLWSGLKAKKYFDISPATVRSTYVTIAIAFFVAAGLIAKFSLGELGMRGVIVSVLVGGIVLAFSRAMPVKTRAGARAHFHVLGFQEFMNRADKDRLERMGKDIFYKYMPYAIALDVVDHWAEAFEGIYGEPPQWYVSPGGFRSFSPAAFSRTIGQVTSSLGAATFSSPRGSGGGGGGGFSGGGGGGGGGGSW